MKPYPTGTPESIARRPGCPRINDLRSVRESPRTCADLLRASKTDLGVANDDEAAVEWPAGKRLGRFEGVAGGAVCGFEGGEKIVTVSGHKTS